VKILIITSRYPPLGASGHDVRCQQVAEALSVCGHRLQVLTSNYRVPPGGVSTDKGVYREFVLSADLTDEQLSQLSYQDVYAIDFENTGALDDRLSRFSPDLVMVWGCDLLSKSLLMRLQQSGVPVAFDLHGNWLQSEAFDRDPWQWWWKHQHSFSARMRKSMMTLTGARRRAWAKLPVYDRSELDFSLSWLASESLRETLVKDGLQEISPVPFVYSALKPNITEPKRHYTHTGRLMWAGRLTEGKAPGLALEAISELNKIGEEVSLDIYGMGESYERKAIRERINEMGLQDSVEMVAIRSGEIMKHYANYDALLVTSQCDDPFPMTPVEAMMVGLPCIVSIDGGLPEIVDDGQTALLYERGNSQALVAAIQRFLGLSDAGAGLAVECRRNLQQKYSMQAYIDKLQDVVFSKLPL